MSYGELLEVEVEQAPEEVADYLRTVADDLESGEDLTIAAGDEEATVAPPAGDVEFEVELEREEGHDDEDDEIELELELEWTPAADEEDDEDELTVE